MRYAVDEHEAKDMTQEGFIRLFSNLDQYSGKGSFEGWARSVFVNTAIKYFHKNRKHRYHTEIDNATGQGISGNALHEMSANELMGLVGQLPDGYRMVFNMYAIEGYSHKEIAEMLDIGESTSRSQLVKARKLLQEKVAAIHNTLV